MALHCFLSCLKQTFKHVRVHLILCPGILDLSADLPFPAVSCLHLLVALSFSLLFLLLNQPQILLCTCSFHCLCSLCMFFPLFQTPDGPSELHLSLCFFPLPYSTSEKSDLLFLHLRPLSLILPCLLSFFFSPILFVLPSPSPPPVLSPLLAAPPASLVPFLHLLPCLPPLLPSTISSARSGGYCFALFSS